MSRVRSGWEKHPVVAQIEDLARDIRARLDAIEAETGRRKEASDIATKFFGRKETQ